MRQILYGIRVIRAFSHESEEKEQISEAVLAQTETATNAHPNSKNRIGRTRRRQFQPQACFDFIDTPFSWL